MRLVIDRLRVYSSSFDRRPLQESCRVFTKRLGRGIVRIADWLITGYVSIAHCPSLDTNRQKLVTSRLPINNEIYAAGITLETVHIDTECISAPPRTGNECRSTISNSCRCISTFHPVFSSPLRDSTTLNPILKHDSEEYMPGLSSRIPCTTLENSL
jgi:hypothetical protein